MRMGGHRTGVFRKSAGALCLGTFFLLAGCEDFDLAGTLDRYREDFHFSYPLSAGGIDPNHYSHYEKVMRLWDYEEERSKDLEEERKGLDERNRSLEREKGQFAQFNGAPVSPEQADQIQSTIRDFNARVTALKKAQEAFNAKVASINKIQLTLRCKYEMNPAPVKTIEAWWPN